MFINNIMFTSKMLRSYKKVDKEETTNRSKLHKHYLHLYNDLRMRKIILCVFPFVSFQNKLFKKATFSKK